MALSNSTHLPQMASRPLGLQLLFEAEMELIREADEKHAAANGGETTTPAATPKPVKRRKDDDDIDPFRPRLVRNNQPRPRNSCSDEALVMATNFNASALSLNVPFNYQGLVTTALRFAKMHETSPGQYPHFDSRCLSFVLRHPFATDIVRRFVELLLRVDQLWTGDPLERARKDHQVALKKYNHQQKLLEKRKSQLEATGQEVPEDLRQLLTIDEECLPEPVAPTGTTIDEDRATLEAGIEDESLSSEEREDLEQRLAAKMAIYHSVDANLVRQLEHNLGIVFNKEWEIRQMQKVRPKRKDHAVQALQKKRLTGREYYLGGKAPGGRNCPIREAKKRAPPTSKELAEMEKKEKAKMQQNNNNSSSMTLSASAVPLPAPVTYDPDLYELAEGEQLDEGGFVLREVVTMTECEDSLLAQVQENHTALQRLVELSVEAWAGCASPSAPLVKPVFMLFVTQTHLGPPFAVLEYLLRQTLPPLPKTTTAEARKTLRKKRHDLPQTTSSSRSPKPKPPTSTAAADDTDDNEQPGEDEKEEKEEKDDRPSTPPPKPGMSDCCVQTPPMPVQVRFVHVGADGQVQQSVVKTVKPKQQQQPEKEQQQQKQKASSQSEASPKEQEQTKKDDNEQPTSTTTSTSSASPETTTKKEDEEKEKEKAEEAPAEKTTSEPAAAEPSPTDAKSETRETKTEETESGDKEQPEAEQRQHSSTSMLSTLEGFLSTDEGRRHYPLLSLVFKAKTHSTEEEEEDEPTPTRQKDRNETNKEDEEEDNEQTESKTMAPPLKSEPTKNNDNDEKPSTVEELEEDGDADKKKNKDQPTTHHDPPERVNTSHQERRVQSRNQQQRVVTSEGERRGGSPTSRRPLDEEDRTHHTKTRKDEEGSPPVASSQPPHAATPQPTRNPTNKQQQSPQEMLQPVLHNSRTPVPFRSTGDPYADNVAGALGIKKSPASMRLAAAKVRVALEHEMLKGEDRLVRLLRDTGHEQDVAEAQQHRPWNALTSSELLAKYLEEGKMPPPLFPRDHQRRQQHHQPLPIEQSQRIEALLSRVPRPYADTHPQSSTAVRAPARGSKPANNKSTKPRYLPPIVQRDGDDTSSPRGTKHDNTSSPERVPWRAAGRAPPPRASPREQKEAAKHVARALVKEGNQQQQSRTESTKTTSSTKARKKQEEAEFAEFLKSQRARDLFEQERKEKKMAKQQRRAEQQDAAASKKQ